MTFKNTTLGAALAILAIALAIFTVSRPHSMAPQPERNQAATTSAVATPKHATLATATLKVGTTTYALAIRSGETVVDLMQDAKATGSFSFTGKDYPSLGLFVESINGIENEGSEGWFLYVNGTSSELGASSVIVRPGDRVEWRYEQNHY